MSWNREKILNDGCMARFFTPSPAHGMGTLPGMRGCCGHPGCHNTQPMQHRQPLPMPTYAGQSLVGQGCKRLGPQQIFGANYYNTGSNVVSPCNQGMLMGQGNMAAFTYPAGSMINHMGGTVQNQKMGGGGQGGMANQDAGMGQNQMIRDGQNQVISESAQRMGQNCVNMKLGDSKKNSAQGMSGMPDNFDMTALPTKMMANGVPQMGAGVPLQVSKISPMGGGFPPTEGGAPWWTSGMPPMTNPNNINVNRLGNQHHHQLGHMFQNANMAQMPQSIQQSQPKAEFNKYKFPQIQDQGFDPMALAIQMNPDKQQQATIGAMHTMAHSLATGPQTHSKTPHANAPQTYANAPQSFVNTSQTYASDANKEISNNYSNYNNDINYNNVIKVNNNGTSRVLPSSMVCRNGVTLQNQVPYHTWTHHQYHRTPLQGQSNLGQQNSQFYDQQNLLQRQYQAAGPAATTVPAAFVHAPTSTMRQQKAVKEPILPVDTRNIRYNTLGQSYEVIPQHMIHRPNFPLPQTLSPTPPPVKPMKFGTVKSTISKTALMGMRPVGKQPSQSQLQQLYKQYRGSNSYPDLGGVVTPYKEKTNQPLAPLENVGDVSNTKEGTINLQQVDGDQIGDTPMIEKIVEENDGTTPLHYERRRNGLQDVVSTQYTRNKSPKWSFHGIRH